MKLEGLLKKDFIPWLESKRGGLGKASFATVDGTIISIDTVDIFHYLPMLIKFQVYVEFFEYNSIFVELVAQDVSDFEVLTSFTIKEFTRRGWLEYSANSVRDGSSERAGLWESKEDTMRQALIEASKIFNINKAREND